MIKEITIEDICQHNWEKKAEDRKVIVTPYENHPEARKKYLYVLILVCNKCGKLDKTVERI